MEARAFGPYIMGQTDNNEDDVPEVEGGGQETETFRLQDAAKWESSEEEKGREKEAPVIKARSCRVCRSGGTMTMVSRARA